MKTRLPLILPAFFLLGVLLIAWRWDSAPLIPRSSGPFLQEAYVWQRQWDETTKTAIESIGPEFSSLTLLAAEVTWRNGIPNVVRVHPHYESLNQIDRPIGFAIRIESFPGKLGENDLAITVIKELALSLTRESKRHGIRLSEIQLDFDCPESKLDDYQRWASEIRTAIQPAALGITALPSWLNQPACRRLFTTADRVVLQVHSLQAPAGDDSEPMLCDPLMATRAIETLATFGIPFRVALPTYTYLLAYNPQGQLAGLSAEGPIPSWPDTYRIHPLKADPDALCGLVNAWTHDRPANLKGVIWYRLPVERDRYNWAWPTLNSVMNGVPPTRALQVRVKPADSGLFDLVLINEGSDDHTGNVTIHVHWNASSHVASDALSSFRIAAFSDRSLTIKMEKQNWRLAPNASIPLAWLRLTRHDELDITIETGNDH